MIVITLLLSSVLLTYYLLYNDNDILISLLKSYLLEDKYDKKTGALVLAFVFPFTLPYYLILKYKNKMSLKKFLTGVIIAVVLFLAGSFIYDTANKVIEFSNQEISLTTQFKQHEQERITFYDKAYKQVASTAQVALRNDTSFANIVNIVMSGQPQNLSAFMGAVHLIDPSANYSQVSSFYQQLLDLANSNREGFFEQEKQLQQINAAHENLLKLFPGSLYNYFLHRNSFNYIPITSTRSQNVEKTHTDDHTDIFK